MLHTSPHPPPGWPSSMHFSGFDREWHSWRFLAHGRPNLRMSGTINQPDLPAHRRQLNWSTGQKYRQVDRNPGQVGWDQRCQDQALEYDSKGIQRSSQAHCYQNEPHLGIHPPFTVHPPSIITLYIHQAIQPFFHHAISHPSIQLLFTKCPLCLITVP